MAVLFMDPGAGVVDEERRYGGQITAVVVLSCTTGSMAGAIFGYDLGLSEPQAACHVIDGAVAEGILPVPGMYPQMNSGHGRGISNYCKFNSQLLTLFTSSLYISGLLTAILMASWVTARRGHRPSMIIGAVACLAGAAFSSGAVNVYMTILGRVLLGVGLGFANQVRSPLTNTLVWSKVYKPKAQRV